MSSEGEGGIGRVPSVKTEGTSRASPISGQEAASQAWERRVGAAHAAADPRRLHHPARHRIGTESEDEEDDSMDEGVHDDATESDINEVESSERQETDEESCSEVPGRRRRGQARRTAPSESTPYAEEDEASTNAKARDPSYHDGDGEADQRARWDHDVGEDGQNDHVADDGGGGGGSSQTCVTRVRPV